MKPSPWSHTALSAFRNCPRQFAEVRVYKNYQDEPGEAAVWGDHVHQALEALIRHGTPLPENMAYLSLRVEAVLNGWLGGLTPDVQAEHRMALTTALLCCTWTTPNVWVRGIADVLKAQGTELYILDWKGLDVNTLIPTPAGFSTMGELSVGDAVFGGDGKICLVVGKSGTHNRRCFRVELDDKTSVVCDDVHLWKLADGRVVPVTELIRGDTIPLAAPLQLPRVDLPIDPYVLGLWLADGKHTSSEVRKPDAFVWDEVRRRGYALGLDSNRNNGRCCVRTVRGIRAHLKALGVHGNKHIPDLYMRASYTQRLDLVRGLMDGDGNANPVRRQAVFTSCSRRLSDQVTELLASLGQRVNQAETTQRGFGLTVTAYPLSFRPQGMNPFLLPRKADRISAMWGKGRSHCRRVTAVAEVPSVPTQCIAVNSADNTYLCTENMIPTHNTGKVKPDNRQLMLFALLGFHHFPAATVCHTRFEWLAHGVASEKRFSRDEMPALWQEFVPDLQAYRQAFAEELWPPRPSGLCSGWCPVETCQHWKPRR